jgi:hypothetical protein
MALPIQIGDDIIYYAINVTAKAQALSGAAEAKESVVGILLKADPANAQNALVGDANNQGYPLVPGETLSIKLSRRNKVYVRGTTGSIVHVMLVMTSGNLGAAYAQGWVPLGSPGKRV